MNDFCTSVSTLTLKITLGLLILLLAAAIVVQWFSAGPLRMTLSLILAFGKSALIFAFFMRLRVERAAVAVVVAVSICLLAVLFVLTLVDYATR